MKITPSNQLTALTGRDLEHALSPRTAPSSLRIAMLGALSEDGHKHEATDIEEVEHRILRALAERPGSSVGPSALLASIDLAQVTQDNDWRGLLAAVRALHPVNEELSRAAITKYAAYLASVRELIQAIRANRPAQSAPRNVRAEPDDGVGLELRQHLIFDLDQLAGRNESAWSSADGDRDDGVSFGRLPKGEPVEIELTAYQSVDLLLARHRFALVSGSPYVLVDQKGYDYRLKSGKNVVGRSDQCDLAVDPEYRAVSRKHVIVEATLGAPVRITDISSLGTFVPREHLDPLLH